MANNISEHQPYTVDETLDVFHRGAFHLVQPAMKGHRSGVDAMIRKQRPAGFFRSAR